MRYGFVARHQSIWPVRTMCRMLEVSHGGFYDWSARAPSRHTREDARLAGLVQSSFLASDKTYGSPRVWRDLYGWAERCSRKRVERLMRAERARSAVCCRAREPEVGGGLYLPVERGGLAVRGSGAGSI